MCTVIKKPFVFFRIDGKKNINLYHQLLNEQLQLAYLSIAVFAKRYPVNSRFDLIDVPAEVRELLVEMSRLVGPNLHAECDGNVTKVVETPIVVYITVKSALLTLDWSTDEQYVLDVQTKGKYLTHSITHSKTCFCNYLKP